MAIYLICWTSRRPAPNTLISFITRITFSTMKGANCVEASRMTSAIAIVNQAFIDVDTFLLGLSIMKFDIAYKFLSNGSKYWLYYNKYFYLYFLLIIKSLCSMTTGIAWWTWSTPKSWHCVHTRTLIEARISNITFINIYTHCTISSKSSRAWPASKVWRTISIETLYSLKRSH